MSTPILATAFVILQPFCLSNSEKYTFVLPIKSRSRLRGSFSQPLALQLRAVLPGRRDPAGDELQIFVHVIVLIILPLHAASYFSRRGTKTRLEHDTLQVVQFRCAAIASQSFSHLSFYSLFSHLHAALWTSQIFFSKNM